MPGIQLNTRELMAMANEFSGCRIDSKYFPVMLNSPLIVESLHRIYILQKNKKLSLEDTQEIRRVFRDYFSFFAEPSYISIQRKNNKKYLVFSIIFFILLLASGVGCIYFPIIFLPFVFIFAISSIGWICLINTNKTYSSEITSIQDNFKHELFALKYNLNLLQNSLADKYQVNVNNFLEAIYALLQSNFTENSHNKKKQFHLHLS